jgi:hypothetical protein
MATWDHPLLPRLLVYFARVVLRRWDGLRGWDTHRSSTFPFDAVAGPMIVKQASLLGFEDLSAGDDGQGLECWALGVARDLNESLTTGSSFDRTWPERARLLQGPRIPPPAPVPPQSPDNNLVAPASTPPGSPSAVSPPPPNNQAVSPSPPGKQAAPKAPDNQAGVAPPAQAPASKEPTPPQSP